MWADVLTKPLQGQLFRDMRAFLQNCSRDYDDNLERQEDEQAHHMMKQQVTTVTSGRECVGEQSPKGLNSGALVNSSALANHECSALVNHECSALMSSGALVSSSALMNLSALKGKVRRRSSSPKCVSWVSPSKVSGKKACNGTQESIRSKNLDRPRALMPSR